MDCVCCFRYMAVTFALTIALTLGPSVQTTSAPQAQTYPGQVVEIESNRPLLVAVKAWPESKQTSTEGGCPLFGTVPFDSTNSNSNDGRFQLRIDPKYATYTTTYCASGYFPRWDRDNRTIDPEVLPKPVELYPKSQSTLNDNLVRKKTVSALNSLAYLRSVNKAQFDQIIGDIPNAGPLSTVLEQWSK
jgi:hypothetical protein